MHPPYQGLYKTDERLNAGSVPVSYGEQKQCFTSYLTFYFYQMIKYLSFDKNIAYFFGTGSR
jgi:hypothetical protein